jgi:hypothetical protein
MEARITDAWIYLFSRIAHNANFKLRINRYIKETYLVVVRHLGNMVSGVKVHWWNGGRE